MNPLQKKLNVLSQIGRNLNENDITWAVGASLLLYFKGIASDFHDIDVMVAEEDAEQAKEVLWAMGTLQPFDPNAQYATKCFLEFDIDGVEVDMMAGFTILREGREHYFPLRQEDVQDYTEVNGIEVPLQSVQSWRHYYELMGREDKVKLIDGNENQEWLRIHGVRECGPAAEGG